MNMSEKDFQNFLANNPNYSYNKKTGKVTLTTTKTPKSANPEKAVPINDLQNENLEEENKKNPKYLNSKVYIFEDGTVSSDKKESNSKIVSVFDSKKEYRRWQELLLMEQAGEISGLKRQCSILIEEGFYYHGKKIQAIKYKADHLYVRDGNIVVEDVKPFDKKRNKYRTTHDFDLKWKLLKKKYPDYYFELY